MPCRYPLDAARIKGSGDKPIIYAHGRRPDPLAEGWEALQLPCGQCKGCRLEQSRVWGARIAHEAAYIEEEYGLYSSFITLTYAEKHLPMYGSLVPDHLSEFIKKLRRHIAPRKIRYYGSGEYGSTCPQHKVKKCPICGPIQRPHYHIIILGFDWPDRYYVGDREGLSVYYSDTLEKLWDKGFHEIGSCSFESASYCARYVMAKVNGKEAKYGSHYTRLCPWTMEWHEVEPEFARMSRGNRKGSGGIGKDWYDKHKHNMYPHDRCSIPGRGFIGTPPKYYDKLFGQTNPDELEVIKEARTQKMLDSLENGPGMDSRIKNEDARIAMLNRSL